MLQQAHRAVPPGKASGGMMTGTGLQTGAKQTSCADLDLCAVLVLAVNSVAPSTLSRQACLQHVCGFALGDVQPHLRPLRAAPTHVLANCLACAGPHISTLKVKAA